MDEIDQAIENLKHFESQLPFTVQKFGDDKALEFLNLVMTRTPVDTGKLRSSWKCNSFGSSGNVYLDIANDTEYASWVEFGHNVVSHGKKTGTHVPARYMMTKSIADIVENSQSDLDLRIEQLLRRCGIV